MAKIEEDPERLEASITFAGQVFKEGWIVAKASYYYFIRERGPVEAKDRAVKLVNDTKSKSKPKPWVLTAAEGARIEAAL